MRIGQLEKELQQKDRKIYELEGEMGLVRSKSSKIVMAEIYPEKKIVTTKKETVASESTPKRIQIALKKAGFYNGPVDGKIGKNTKDAIKEFQKKNGLKSDGIVGKKTWAALSKYLN
ncbi:MAG: peptidoglycan-binding protein [Candidatus Omnitrophica bacterium]|nr:peptidoglycan-binding protein [Candidatus Omnitrophota bacterium]